MADQILLKAARELVELRCARLVPLVVEQVRAEVAPHVPADRLEDIVVKFKRLAFTRLDEFLGPVAEGYAEKLTLDEIVEVIKFYKTSTGTKLNESESDLSGNHARLSIAWSQGLLRDAMMEANVMEPRPS